jgi:hydrogenase maturation protease
LKRDLQDELRDKLAGRAALVGIGNVDLGDDGLGVRLAERLQRAGFSSAVVGGTVPENIAGSLARRGYDHIVFLDAVDFGAAPGSVVFMGATEIQTRFPQISTHKISLGMTARMIESECRARVWLLGVQPASLRTGSEISAPVKQTLKLLDGLLTEALCGHGVKTEAKCPCT